VDVPGVVVSIGARRVRAHGRLRAQVDVDVLVRALMIMAEDMTNGGRLSDHGEIE
jgi:hypothetical protein